MPPVGIDKDKEHYEALVKRQTKDYQNHGTPRNYVSFPIGSTVAVQCEDGEPWTHGTVEGKGDHNHHDRSYNICITKTGWLVTRDRKHIKPTQITAKQYLWEQLQKHTTDPLDDILEQLDKQPHTSNAYPINNGPCTNHPRHEYTTPCKGPENDQIDKEANSGHINSGKRVISKKRVPVSRDGIHKSKDSDSYLWITSGRIVRKSDRLAY